MTRGLLILRGLRFYWRTNLAVALGTAAACAVLVGALAVGDCVRGTLRAAAEGRLGNVELALSGQDRFFRQELTAQLAADLNSPAAALMQLAGTVARADGQARANDVRVLGVDAAFWLLGPAAAVPLADDEALSRFLPQPAVHAVRRKVSGGGKRA